MTALAVGEHAALAGRRSPLGLALRKVPAALIGFALVVVAGASSFSPAPATDLARVPLTESMRMQLPSMSTGSHQQLVGVGQSAQARNARIELAGGALAKVGGFAEISPQSAQYDTALKCMTQAIYYEAANEPELGKRAVAQVVLNRLRHPAYPDSVCGVVYEGANAPVCQFSFTCDGSLLRPPMARQWQESRRVAQAALAGSVLPQVGSATNYHADYVLPRWAFTLDKLQKIGAHIFYRFPGRAGSATVFSDSWSGLERIPTLDLARLRRNLGADDTALAQPEAPYVPGLTVAPDVKDRHAANDVGGRLDTTTGWQLSIPDTDQLSSGYRSAVSSQGSADTVTLAAQSDGATSAAAEQ